ncbi:MULTISPECIES: DUF4230 domain-containing protein [unclassified Ekhidna]|jgi:hypothetical protein|uniref:DUF4230 domain-containing protein n=1 Tax=unclassified Ekhidna TaxID=2632188 RepID=UPI0032DFD4ED
MKRLIYIVSLFVLLSACKDDRGLVVGKIKKASKLATTEFTIDKMVYGVKRKRLLWVVKLNEAKFLAHSKAIVKAGVDLEKLRKEDVDIEGKSISLKLPPVEVINFSYPAELFEMDTLISTDAFLNRISLNDQEKFFQDAEIDIRNSLKHMNIIEATEKKTRIMLENLLRTLGYQEIYIEFHKGELIPEITEKEVGI